MPDKSTPAPVNEKMAANEKYTRNDPRALGTHPDSFQPHDLERNFTPSDNSALDKLRWLKNEFFETRGPSITVRLDDLHHGPDYSDRQLAADIMMRAGLTDHPRSRELTDIFARGLSTISDPDLWLNPAKEFFRDNNSAASKR